MRFLLTALGIKSDTLSRIGKLRVFTRLWGLIHDINSSLPPKSVVGEFDPIFLVWKTGFVVCSDNEANNHRIKRSSPRRWTDQ